MPLEIRELVIKATISTSDSVNPPPEIAVLGEQESTAHDALVNACVEKVLAILKEKSER